MYCEICSQTANWNLFDDYKSRQACDVHFSEVGKRFEGLFNVTNLQEQEPYKKLTRKQIAKLRKVFKDDPFILSALSTIDFGIILKNLALPKREFVIPKYGELKTYLFKEKDDAQDRGRDDSVLPNFRPGETPSNPCKCNLCLNQ